MKARLGSGVKGVGSPPSLATVPASQDKYLPILETTEMAFTNDADFLAVDNNLGEQTSTIIETERQFPADSKLLPDPPIDTSLCGSLTPARASLRS